MRLLSEQNSAEGKIIRLIKDRSLYESRQEWAGGGGGEEIRGTLCGGGGGHSGPAGPN